MKVAIVGGGISGLTTAFYLKKYDSSLEVDVFEKYDTLGGKMRTEKKDDFLFEAGTNGFLSNKPDTLELVKDADAEHLLLKSNDLARVRFIYKNSLEPLPETAKAFATTKLLSFKGKVRVLFEPLIKAKQTKDDETLQSFGYRRVGKEMTDTFLDAMVAGIYGSTPNIISVNSAFPLVVNLEKEYGGLFAGMIKKRKKSAGPGGILMSFKQGVSTFIDHLSKVSQANIHINSKVTKIEKENDKYLLTINNETKAYDNVVLTSPTFISSELVRYMDADLCYELKRINYTPISIVGFGYDEFPHDLKGFGLLTTSSAKLDILGIVWDSSIFPDRAQNGKKCIRVMIGGQRDKHIALKSNKELIRMAKEGIKKTMGVECEPSVSFVQRYRNGIPNYALGHQKRVENIFNTLKNHKGFYLNSNAYNGVALNDCVRNSRLCAEQILKDIK